MWVFTIGSSLLLGLLPSLGVPLQAQSTSTVDIPSRLCVGMSYVLPTDKHPVSGGPGFRIEYQRAVRPLIMATLFCGVTYLPSSLTYVVPAADFAGGSATTVAAGAGLQVLGFGTGRPGDRAYPYLTVVAGVEKTTISELTIEGDNRRLLDGGETHIGAMYGAGLGIAGNPWGTLRFDGAIQYVVASVNTVSITLGIGCAI